MDIFSDIANIARGSRMLRDVSHVAPNNKLYGGLACTKRGITIDGIDYILKFPDNLKAKNLKNVELDYSNGPISEHLGSLIFKAFGIPTHDTELVTCDGKICVMCKDFTSDTKRLHEFRELKSTYEDDNDIGYLLGSDSKLSDVLTVLRNHRLLANIGYREEWFWSVFIIDALIGNRDRNNGNWGIVINGDEIALAPVYDNGNSLCSKWSTARTLDTMSDEDRFLAEAYNSGYCWFTKDNGKNINAFKLIASGKYELCTKQLERLMNRVSINELYDIVDSIPTLSLERSKFYKMLLKYRLEYLINTLWKLIGSIEI